MKTNLLFLFLIISNSGFAQVGINTTTPNAMLDIASSTNGILIPQIDLTANNIVLPVVNPQGGAVAVSTLIYNKATVTGANGVLPGYYYWNGTLWIPFSEATSNDWKVFGNTAIVTPIAPAIYGTSTIALTENFVGTTDANDVVIGADAIERIRIKKGSGNIGIGTANPTAKLHISTTTASATATLSENLFSGNSTGIAVSGSAINNPGYGIGGQFFGGSVGLEGFANASNYSGTAVGIKGTSFGDGGTSAYRVGGRFESFGANGNNYGGQFSAIGGTNNYGADFQAVGSSIRNYGGNFKASGGTTGNWAGVFNSTGGVIATGADFIASNGSVVTTAAYFQAYGTSENYGNLAIVSNGATNFGGSFITNGISTSTNYSGYFKANGGTNNYAGYFAAVGGINNYALVVPPASGNVGIGTITPFAKLDIFSPGNTVGFRLLSGSNAELSYISVGKATEYAQIGACTTGTFFLDALNGDMAIKNFNSGKILLGASFIANAAMAIIPNGSVGIGTSNPVDQLEVANGYVRSTGYRCRTGTSGVYPGNVHNINWTGTTAQLWIDTTNVGTFQFTSDRRLKENISIMNNDALSRVMLLKPVRFNYKKISESIFSGSDQVVEGFIADELQQIIPSAVNGEKEALTKDGKIQPQTLNIAPIISVLTRAMQQQQEMLKTLTEKNTQLELRLKKLEKN